MININDYISDPKFLKLSESLRDSVPKLDKELTGKGYEYYGIWRDDEESGGNVSVFKLKNSTEERENLITLRPLKSYLKVEVYKGYSKNIPYDKKPKLYFKVMDNQAIPEKLLQEIDELYNYFFKC